MELAMEVGLCLHSPRNGGAQLNARTVFQLIFLSLIVGLLLSWFGVTPANFWNSMGNLAVQAWESGVAFFDWALIYIIIGGAVVVPVYLVRQLPKIMRRKPHDPSEEN